MSGMVACAVPGPRRAHSRCSANVASPVLSFSFFFFFFSAGSLKTFPGKGERGRLGQEFRRS